MDSFVLDPTPAAWLQQSEFAPSVPAYRRYLATRRYAISTQRTYLCCVAHFAHWLTEEQRSACDLSGDTVRDFLDQHLPYCTCSAPVRRGRNDLRAALRHLRAVLIDQGVVVEHPAPGAIEETGSLSQRPSCRTGPHLVPAIGASCLTSTPIRRSATCLKKPGVSLLGEV